MSPRKKPAPPKTERPGGRGVWSGQLRLALVSFPVELVSAVKPGARLAFHQVDAKSHKRIHYEKVAPGIGRVSPENIMKGYEISKGNYVLVTDDDLEKVKIEATRVIDLVQFVDHCEIDPIYFDKPYYVLAEGKLAAEAYSVLRDAMRATGKMGLGQFVMRGREYVAALRPCGQGLLLETLRFSDEVRAAAPYFADVTDAEADPELLDLAKDLIKRKAKKFDAGRFHDHYTEALRRLIDAKSKHQISVEDIVDETTVERGNVIDLVEALRRSVKENSETPAVKTKPAAPKRAAPKPAAPKAAGGKRQRIA
jgi:DNA end-binding protein Ku